MPIAPGPRHALSLYLPLLFCGFLFMNHPLWRRAPSIVWKSWHPTPRAFHTIGVLLLIHDLWFVFPTLILTGYAGR